MESRFPYLPSDLSTHGSGIDFLIVFLHIFMVALFAGWGIYFVYALWKFRSRAGHKASYTPIKAKASKYIEIAVIVVEVALLIGLSMPIWAEFKTIPATAGEGKGGKSMTVRVVAQQFAWNLHYPGKDGVFGKTSIDKIDDVSNPLGLDDSDPAAADDFTEVNEFAIPVDTNVVFEISSKDVIHSFFIPRLRIKQDAVPGMRIPIHVTAAKAGDSEVACAQLCGAQHFKMRGHVEIMTQENYDKWLTGRSLFAPEKIGTFAPAAGEGAAPKVETAPAAAAPAGAAPAAAAQPAAAPAVPGAPRDFGSDGFDN